MIYESISSTKGISCSKALQFYDCPLSIKSQHICKNTIFKQSNLKPLNIKVKDKNLEYSKGVKR
jgi:hypothetical protein